MLGRVIEQMEPDALRRILDAPVEKWEPGVYLGKSGGSCLVGHALGPATVPVSSGYLHELDFFQLALRRRWLRGVVEWDPALRSDTPVAHFKWQAGVAEGRFDNLCERFGVPRVVRAVKLRALRALEFQVGTTVPVREEAVCSVA